MQTQPVKVSPAQARRPRFRHPVGALQGWALTASAPQGFTLLDLRLLQPPGRMGNGSSLMGPTLWSRFRLWFPMCHLPMGGGAREPQDAQEGDSVPQTSAFLRGFKRCMSISVLNPIK